MVLSAQPSPSVAGCSRATLRELYGTNSLGISLVESFETVLFAWLLVELLQSRGGMIARVSRCAR
jgi:hypothetical protein